MSGLEVIGALAATSQFVSYAFKIVEALSELRNFIQHSPSQIRHYIDQLDALVCTIKYIEGNRSLHTNIVETLLRAISQKVDVLNDLLSQSYSGLTQPSLRRFIHILTVKKVEKFINEKFVALEIDKSSLVLCITGSCSETLVEICSKFQTISSEESHDHSSTMPDFATSNPKLISHQTGPPYTSSKQQPYKAPSNPGQHASLKALHYNGVGVENHGTQSNTGSTQNAATIDNYSNYTFHIKSEEQEEQEDQICRDPSVSLMDIKPVRSRDSNSQTNMSSSKPHSRVDLFGYSSDLINEEKMREYSLCSEGVGRGDALEEIVSQFLSTNAHVKMRDITPGRREYVVALPLGIELSIEDLVKLRQLCRLQSNDLFYRESIKSENNHTLNGSPEPAGMSRESVALGSSFHEE